MGPFGELYRHERRTTNASASRPLPTVAWLHLQIPNLLNYNVTEPGQLRANSGVSAVAKLSLTCPPAPNRLGVLFHLPRCEWPYTNPAGGGAPWVLQPAAYQWHGLPRNPYWCREVANAV